MNIQAGTENRLSDLEQWLQKIEEMGELKRVTAEIDPDLEISTVAYLSGKEIGSPALLFDNIKGHPGGRSLYNALGSSLARICLAIREGPVENPIDLVKKLSGKMEKTMPPEVVDPDEAIVNENIHTGSDIDVTAFPAPRMWPLDGGKYVGTADAVITRDPDSGRINVGTYRMMIKSRNELGLYTSPGKDAGIDMQKWWDQGKPAPVAAVLGLDPLLFIVGATTFPKTESEYDYFGGINGAPANVFESDVTGLLLPAGAEIIIEGFAHPGDTFDEGPFGEFTAYYGRPEAPTPFVRIEKIRHKNRPILTNALMADWPSNECGLFWAMTRAAKVWNDLDRLGVPGIKTVWSPPEAAGWGMTVVSIKQLYAGHAPQVMALAAQCMGGAYFSKYIVVVDDDVDATNVSEVLWAMVTRSRPAESIDILRETWSTYLDPSKNPPSERPWGSKCLINACMEYKHIKDFSPRTKLSKPVYEEVVRRWAELGFEGAAPAVDVFEDKKFPERI